MRAALLLLAASASALYEEPPGGCQGPPDDFVPPPRKVQPVPQNLYQEPPGGCQGPPDDEPVYSLPRQRIVPPSKPPAQAPKPGALRSDRHPLWTSAPPPLEQNQTGRSRLGSWSE